MGHSGKDQRGGQRKANGRHQQDRQSDRNQRGHERYRLELSLYRAIFSGRREVVGGADHLENQDHPADDETDADQGHEDARTDTRDRRRLLKVGGPVEPHAPQRHDCNPYPPGSPQPVRHRGVIFSPLLHEAELCQRPRPSIILSFEKGRKYVA